MRETFFGGVNNLCATFKNVGVKSISSLFNSFCCHFYGSQAWRLRDKYTERIFTAWNKAVRHIFNLPYTTHRYFLPFIVGRLYVKDEIYLRTRKLILTMLNSKNASVNFLTRSNIEIQTSVIGCNWYLINRQLNIDVNCENPKYTLLKRLNETFTTECGVLLEILDILDGQMSVQNFNSYEIKDMLIDICTM